MLRTQRISAAFLGALLAFMPVATAVAQEEEVQPVRIQVNRENNVEDTDKYYIGPTRFLLDMEPGETRTVEVQVMNQEGETRMYVLETEDFAIDPEQNGAATFFPSHAAGPFPARGWLTPEVGSFELGHGERAFIRVRVSVPENAEPGDHYAAVVVAHEPSIPDEQSGFAVQSRVASLFIVSVAGDIQQEGMLEKLTTRRFINWMLPVFLRLTVRNTGNVYMQPTGAIRIRNIFGITVDEIPLRGELVVYRDSVRSEDISWKPRFALGRYTAETDLSAFSGTALASVSTSFWVFPLLPVLIMLCLIFLVSFLVQYFFTRFEIKRKH